MWVNFRHFIYYIICKPINQEDYSLTANIFNLCMG